MVLCDQALACKCDMPSITDSYVAADFVARFEIIQVYPNEGEENIYKADIKILEQFKGPKIESIYIGGRSDGKLGTSCDVFYPEGSDLLVAARAKPDGRIVFGMCSFTIDFKNKRKDNQLEMETIMFMNKHYRDLTIPYLPIISSNFHEFLFSKSGIKQNEKFAIFEVLLDDQVNASEVKTMKGFGGKIDSEIVDELSKSSWDIRFYESDSKIDGPVKVIVPVYFHPEENGEKSFLGNFIF